MKPLWPSRTGSPPTAEDPLLLRVCKALDEPPRLLAYNIGVRFSDVAPLLDRQHALAGLDLDDVWWSVAERVDLRIGQLMAAREDLNRALQRDRSRRAARHAAQLQRGKKERPT